MTTVNNLETEVGENETEEDKRLIKSSKSMEKNPKIDNETGIIHPRSYHTPTLKNDYRTTDFKVNKNMELLNPFKKEKLTLDLNAHSKKHFALTNYKTNSDSFPIYQKKKYNISIVQVEENIYQSKKTKNININLNFHTIDNYEDDEQSDNEESHNNLNDKKEKDFNENDDQYSDDQNNADNQNLPHFNVDDYRFIHQIGHQSFTSIYHCMDKNEQKLAIKKMIFREKEKLDEISNQYDFLYQLEHKNIIKIYGISRRKVESNDHFLYILMELATNDWTFNIRLRIRDKLFYSEKELFAIVIQIIDGLAFLQRNNVYHGDIKPENILFFNNNVCKVSDFGFRKQGMTIINGDSPKFDDLYTSPSIYGLNNSNFLDEASHYSIKSDVYSLGLCILYAATLSINPIFQLREITDKILREIPNQISCYNFLKKCLSNYSQKLLNLVYRMLEPNEELRFDFLDLQNFINKE